MTSMFQGNRNAQQVVGEESKGHLPGPFNALKQGSEGRTMSDLQFMLHNENKQHQEAYGYANGHNDHGMGK